MLSVAICSIVAPFVAILLWFIYTSLRGQSKIPYKHEQILIKVISDHRSCIVSINELLSHSPLFVGIDCEWKSSKEGSNKISLLQIAHSSMILLIRLHLLHPLPAELLSFLNNVQILKCGV
eukprot:98980_1